MVEKTINNTHSIGYAVIANGVSLVKLHVSRHTVDNILSEYESAIPHGQSGRGF